MNMITPIDAAPAGFTLALIDMSSVISTTYLGAYPKVYLHGKTAWVRTNGDNSTKADVIPLMKDGAWNAMFEIIDAAFIV